MKELTLEQFDKLPLGEVFATGVLPNSPDGIFMTNDGGNLRWIAKKGYGHDWAVYCHWDKHSEKYVTDFGDKVRDEKHIKRCVPCTDEVFKIYRY
jgi:hypothetical protein